MPLDEEATYKTYLKVTKMFKFKTDDYVKKVKGYKFVGYVRLAFTKRNGAVRYIVENKDGIVHVFRGSQLTYANVKRNNNVLDWKPIDEAKKDGTPILAIMDKDPAAPDYVYVIKFSNERDCWIEAGGGNYQIYNPVQFICPQELFFGAEDEED